jgi:hypothetical protein
MSSIGYVYPFASLFIDLQPQVRQCRTVLEVIRQNLACNNYVYQVFTTSVVNSLYGTTVLMER